MLSQGSMSTVEVIGDRLFKTIKKINIEGTVIPLYEEYKILKYIQTLGMEFPQNVKCEGPLTLSYDYIKGVTLEFYLKNYQPSIELQKRLGLQFFLIYCKLLDKGIFHEDYHYRNMIIDENNKLYIIDFGMVWFYAKKIGIDWTNLPEDANFNDYPEPVEDYENIQNYLSDKGKLYNIKRIIKTLTYKYKDGLIKDIELITQLNNCNSLQEIINLLK